jgi:hypothetical protein
MARIVPYAICALNEKSRPAGRLFSLARAYWKE